MCHIVNHFILLMNIFIYIQFFFLLNIHAFIPRTSPTEVGRDYGSPIPVVLPPLAPLASAFLYMFVCSRCNNNMSDYHVDYD